MVDPYLWEHCMLGITLLGYAVLAINAFINRRQRWQLSEESKMMSECERCSVELANSLIPTSKAVPEYRFRGMRLKMSSIRIEFDNLGVKLKSTGQCIVEGVSGEFRPKRVAAIMGPTTTGAIRINGQTSSIAEEMINNIVEDVLNVMQLLDVQHSIVGNVEKRGISGGQRKRVNIGLELAARPTILMLDEPTSGLDASTALEIIRSVKRLTAIGMTVVMVVHQPRYSLFTLFDDLLLLGLGGRTVYLGKSEGALPYFRNLGFQMPQHENPADWFMDVISGRVRNEKDPDLQPRQLADAWAELITVMPEELELGHDTSEGQHDSFAFTKALNGKLSSAGYEDVDELSQEQFLNFLDTMQIKRPSEASWARLMERMGFEDGFISRQKLVFFLLGLRGSFSQEPGTRGIGDFISSASESSKETSVSGIPTGKKLGRRGRFLIQYPILLHQNSIRWARDWKHKLISTCLIMFAAAVFGAPCQDKLIPENILCPLKINISHLPIGTLSSIACLHIFGSDRPLFWRESASGVGVTAFYLARLTVSLFDVLMWSYLHTAVWMLFSQAPCSFWMWLIAFRMTAMCASGVGIFMSTLVPKQNSTLATAVVILVMGGAMSEPQVIADAEGLSSALAFVSPFTWTAGQNYLALIDTSGGEEAIGNRPLKQSCKAARGQPMALNGGGFGPLWEPLKVTVEDVGVTVESRGDALSPIGPPAWTLEPSLRHKAERGGQGPHAGETHRCAGRGAAAQLVTHWMLFMTGICPKDWVLVESEENRRLRAALGTLREIGSSVLRGLAANPQEAHAAGDARPPLDGGAPAKVETHETFTFTIRKADNTDLGLDVSSIANQPGLLVEAILPGGAAEAWNKQQDPGRVSRELRPGDTILQVNSAEGAEEMLQECRSKMLLKIKVQRAEKPAMPVPESPPPEKVVSSSPSLQSLSTETSSKHASPTLGSPQWLPTPACLADNPNPMTRRLLVI
eukprot:g11413.t1